MFVPHLYFFFFFFNDTATTEIYTLSLHDALPICASATRWVTGPDRTNAARSCRNVLSSVWSATTISSFSASSQSATDRKSTRLNSSHGYISYAVFCLKKKKYQRY